MLTSAALLVAYLGTLAPGVTFWDAGEFIAAAHGFGIPHPPGTPLYVAAGRAWVLAFGALGAALAMNVLSAAATAAAAGLMALVVARELPGSSRAWSAGAAACMAGLMTSVWSNATETEVYAVALLHGIAIIAAASRAADENDARPRWLLLSAYLIALAPAVHLTALVAAPAAIVLAARERGPGWRLDRVLLLSGALVAAAGVGRMSAWLALAGGAILVSALLAARPAPVRMGVAVPAAALWLVAIASTALLVLLVRAQHDPPLNQGNPATLAALRSVVSRDQYAVAPLFPRQAAVWWQAANVVQYLDWQVAMSWGRGIVTSPARVGATLLWLMLGLHGWRAMRRESRRLAGALGVLLLCGTVGVAAYLNLKLGASLGWGVVPEGSPHEARERDYFFVFGFWAWGCLAGYGAVSLARARGWRPAVGMAALALPLSANWAAVDRSRAPLATAAREVAVALLESAPPGAVLFLDGDNDSYPLWYAQQVERVRRDVVLVTVPLLPAEWYAEEIARRTGLVWDVAGLTAGARTLSEERAARLATASFRAGRPVAASPALPARERGLLGRDWMLTGAVYVAGAERAGSDDDAAARVDGAAARRWVAGGRLPRSSGAPEGDRVAWTMLSLLRCPELGSGGALTGSERDSLEVRCNFR